MWWCQSYKLPHLKVMHIESKTVSTAYEPCGWPSSWLSILRRCRFTSHVDRRRTGKQKENNTQMITISIYGYIYI